LKVTMRISLQVPSRVLKEFFQDCKEGLVYEVAFSSVNKVILKVIHTKEKSHQTSYFNA